MTIISRSMFEALVGVSFVLQQNLRLGHKDIDDKSFTVEDRAKIFVAYGAIESYEKLKEHKDNPDLSAVLNDVDIAPYKLYADEAEKNVGRLWANKFKKHPRTYSGLNLKELSSRLSEECRKYYTQIYGAQSKTIHATDVDSHAEFGLLGHQVVAKWRSSIDEIGTQMCLSSLLLLSILDLLDKQWPFSNSVKVSIQELMDQVQNLGEI